MSVEAYDDIDQPLRIERRAIGLLIDQIETL